MRTRLRPAYTREELAELYPVPHNHHRWPDHKLRVDVTVQVARFLFTGGTVADLSCGDGAIATSLHAREVILGDLAPGYGVHGPLEETIDIIPPVDLFICCETLEHLDDPDLALRKIRPKTKALVLSTPAGEFTGDNPEHYWGWDTDCVSGMLQSAAFVPVVQTVLDVLPLDVTFQIWGCR